MITRQQVAEWQLLRREGYQSAVGEYTPAEFWKLLEEYLIYRGAIEHMFGPVNDDHGLRTWQLVAANEVTPPWPLETQFTEWGIPPDTKRTWKK